MSSFIYDLRIPHTHAPQDDRGQLRRLRLPEVCRLAVIATLSKGYDLDYIWKQVDQGPAKDAAGYYIQASETGGEPASGGSEPPLRLPLRWAIIVLVTAAAGIACFAAAGITAAVAAAAAVAVALHTVLE